MAWYYGNHGDLVYVPNGDPRFNRDGMTYLDPAPVSFRTPPFYDDIYYRGVFRDHHPVSSHGGELIPEQVEYRQEDPYPYPYPQSTPPWWFDCYYPHSGGYPWVLVERTHEDDEEDCNLEFYAPQLGSDRRERDVVDALMAFPGVVNVFADQWEHKVVVVGRGLREEQVLRRLQQVPHMERSVVWWNR